MVKFSHTVFALPFALASGTTIQITNYVSVVGGTMPVRDPATGANLQCSGQKLPILRHAKM